MLLAGGLNNFSFSSLFGEMIQFVQYFSNVLKPPTRLVSFQGCTLDVDGPVSHLSKKTSQFHSLRHHNFLVENGDGAKAPNRLKTLGIQTISAKIVAFYLLSE